MSRMRAAKTTRSNGPAFPTKPIGLHKGTRIPQGWCCCPHVLHSWDRIRVGEGPNPGGEGPNPGPNPIPKATPKPGQCSKFYRDRIGTESGTEYYSGPKCVEIPREITNWPRFGPTTGPPLAPIRAHHWPRFGPTTGRFGPWTRDHHPQAQGQGKRRLGQGRRRPGQGHVVADLKSY